ncbi:MAG TPA: helix-turn-helix domain-containing protein [Chitinophagales bacterium]
MEHITFEELPKVVVQIFNKVEKFETLLLKQIGGQPPQEQQDELLTIQQAAELLKLTVPTLYGKTAKRELPFMKQGKRLYFSRTELLQYLKDGRKKTNAEIEAEAATYLRKR